MWLLFACQTPDPKDIATTTEDSDPDTGTTTQPTGTPPGADDSSIDSTTTESEGDSGVDDTDRDDTGPDDTGPIWSEDPDCSWQGDVFSGIQICQAYLDVIAKDLDLDGLGDFALAYPVVDDVDIWAWSGPFSPGTTTTDQSTGQLSMYGLPADLQDGAGLSADGEDRLLVVGGGGGDELMTMSLVSLPIMGVMGVEAFPISIGVIEGTGSWLVATGDLTGDGDRDVVVTLGSNGQPPDDDVHLAVFPGPLAGHVPSDAAACVSLYRDEWSGDVADSLRTTVADMDGDGMDDLLLPKGDDTEMFLVPGPVPARFSEADALLAELPEELRDAVAGDFDGDGYLDALIGTERAAYVYPGPIQDGQDASTALLRADTGTTYPWVLPDSGGDGGVELGVWGSDNGVRYIAIYDSARRGYLDDVLDPPDWRWGDEVLEAQLPQALEDVSGDGVPDVAFGVSAAPDEPPTYVMFGPLY